ncbi:unnamed protein product [Caenorhabditis nigoni]
MRKMKWDASLAASAQKYADGCPYSYSYTEGVGGNIHTIWSPYAHPTNLDNFGAQAPKAWANEFQLKGWTSILLDAKTFNSGIRNATQMAWAETNLVGCGVKNCGKDMRGNLDYYKTVVVCQYKKHTTAQTAIVKAHNDLRSAIAKGIYNAKGTIEPAAANMRKMKWDASLAASAQKYADTCPRGHSGVSGLGENMYWRWSPSALPTNLDEFGVAASKAWEEEFQDFGWTSILLDRKTFDTHIGHATQMAWAQSYLVGCGVKNCGRDTLYRMYKVAVVCHYKEQ